MAGRVLEIILRATDNTAAGVDSATQRFGGLGGKLAGLASAATGALIIGQVATYMRDAAAAAAQDEQSHARLAQTLRSVTGATDAQLASIEAYILKTSLAAGVADDQLRPAFSKLMVATGNVAEAQDLMTIAMDVAQGRGLELETVVKALARAQDGNVEGLQRLGVSTKDASGATLTYEQILQTLSDTYGGAVAVNAETAAGKQARLAVGMAELKETVGTALLPALQRLVGVGMQVLTWFQSLPGPVQQIILVGGLLAAALAGLAMVIGPLIPLVSGLAVAKMALLGPIALIVAGIAAVVAIVILCIKYHEEIGAAFVAAWDAIKFAFSAAWDFIKRVFAAVWPYLLGVATGGIGLIVVLLVKHWDIIKAGFIAAWDAIKAAFSAAWDAIKAVFVAALDWVRGIPDRILAALGFLGRLLYGVGEDILRGLWDGLVWIWENIVKPWLNLKDKLADAMRGAARWLYNIGADILGGLWEGIQSAAGWIGDKIRSLIKAIIPDFMEDWFGIDSPSKLMAGIGADIMLGLQLGMERSAPAVMRTVGDIARAVEDGLAVGVGPGPGLGLTPAAAGGRGATIHIGSITIDGSRMTRPDFEGLIASIQTAARMGG